MARLVVRALLLAFVPSLACVGGSGQPAPKPKPNAAAGDAKAAPASSAASRPEFVHVGDGAVDTLVKDAMVAAEQERRQLLVYVGATWCEPCQAFHDALERGELDDALAGVRFVEFDSDDDGARLKDAEYGGRYIPRFVVPSPDGRGGDRRMEGGIKGAGAVANIMERLVPLVSGAK